MTRPAAEQNGSRQQGGGWAGGQTDLENLVLFLALCPAGYCDDSTMGSYPPNKYRSLLERWECPAIGPDPQPPVHISHYIANCSLSGWGLMSLMIDPINTIHIISHIAIIRKGSTINMNILILILLLSGTIMLYSWGGRLYNRFFIGIW